MLIGLDVAAFVPGTGWTPEGCLKSGTQYQEAAAKVFRFPPEGPSRDPGERMELPLNGVWQTTRFDDPDMDKDTYEPVKALPQPDEYELRWRGVKVPGDASVRPDMIFAHRTIYQTKVDIPVGVKGRSVVLHFSGISWIVSVSVNGPYVGASTVEPQGKETATATYATTRLRHQILTLRIR